MNGPNFVWNAGVNQHIAMKASYEGKPALRAALP